MGRLVIAHHKSYHPYRRDNIERVRRDEEEARRKEAQEDGKMMLADSEARITHLRERAGGQKSSKKKGGSEAMTAGGSSLSGASSSHINFFEDLEQRDVSIALRGSKKFEPAETDKGVPLAPTSKDLKPWYSNKTNKGSEETEDDRRRRDAERKSREDPLSSINRQLASIPSDSASTSYKYRSQNRHHSTSFTNRSREVDSREPSDRRALDHGRRKREMERSESPPGDGLGGYSNLYNRKEVEEAHQKRERRPSWSRGRGRAGWQGRY